MVKGAGNDNAGDAGHEREAEVPGVFVTAGVLPDCLVTRQVERVAIWRGDHD